MPNQLWAPAREGLLTGQIDWDTGVFKAALVRGYTFVAAHRFVSDVVGAGGTLVATSVALANKTSVNGAADADDVAWPAVAAGAAIPHVILFQSSAPTGGADLATTAQRLLGFWDTAGTTLPVTPDGRDITFQWPNVAPFIFTL